MVIDFLLKKLHLFVNSKTFAASQNFKIMEKNKL